MILTSALEHCTARLAELKGESRPSVARPRASLNHLPHEIRRWAHSDKSFSLTACGKTQIFVIPRRAARRGISLFLGLNQRGIPHFVRKGKINYFFGSLFKPLRSKWMKNFLAM